MSNRKYSKILLVMMSVMMCGLIVMQFYLTMYVRKSHETVPVIITWCSLFISILVLVIMLASSRVNKDVGNMVFTDVTGIKNKLAYQDYINRINERKDTFSTGVVMFDLNNLKIVNDSLGHEIGDLYIGAFSAILSKVQKDRVNAYRIGGDEFAVILEETNVVEIHHMLDYLEKSVREYNEKHHIKISYARGYEVSTREHYYLMEELTRRADEHMYKNKRMSKKGKLDRKQLR